MAERTVSRRAAIFGSVAAAISGFWAKTVEAQRRVSKRYALYRNRPNGRQRCGGCRYFRDPGSCVRVEGRISPMGYCDLYAT